MKLKTGEEYRSVVVPLREKKNSRNDATFTSENN